jgi:hypothetical protein
MSVFQFGKGAEKPTYNSQYVTVNYLKEQYETCAVI